MVEAMQRDGADGKPAFRFVGFVADAIDAELLARRGAPHLGPSGDLIDVLRSLGPDAHHHFALGAGETRGLFDRRLREDAPELAARAATLVHPLASLGSDLRIAPGVLLAAGARVTTNVTLGRHTHLNVNAVVSHDSVIGDYVTLSPGALVNGSVTLGDRVFLGTGAIVLPGRTVGDDTVVAAGAVVTENLPANVTARGVPARWQ